MKKPRRQPSHLPEADSSGGSLRPIRLSTALRDKLHADAATLERMIQVARRGRSKRKEEQKRGQVSQGHALPGPRVRIIERDKATCYMCHRKLAIEEITLDHVRPRSRGGDESDDNLKVACDPCNNRKGDRLPEECEWLRQ